MTSSIVGKMCLSLCIALFVSYPSRYRLSLDFVVSVLPQLEISRVWDLLLSLLYLLSQDLLVPPQLFPGDGLYNEVVWLVSHFHLSGV